MKIIGGCIADVLRNPFNETLQKKTSDQVKALCDAFPLYPQAGES
jgi:glycine/serine hydroxymethyltransferase